MKRLTRSIYSRCKWCGKLVRQNKLILGSLHFCLSEGEKKKTQPYWWQSK